MRLPTLALLSLAASVRGDGEGLVIMEGMEHIDPDDQAKLSEGARAMAEQMKKMWVDNRVVREQMRCGACMASARFLAPVLKDLEGKALKEHDVAHFIDKVCEDDGPDVGIEAFRYTGATQIDPVDVNEVWKIVPSPNVPGSNGNPTVRADWTVDITNGVCIEMAEEHMDTLRHLTETRQIISEICVKKTAFCKRTDFLHFIDDVDREDINTRGPKALLGMIQKQKAEDKKLIAQLKCSAQYAVADTLNWRIRNVFVDMKNKTITSKGLEGEYTMTDEDYERAAKEACEEDIIKAADWSYSYDWFKDELEPIYLGSGGIKIPSDNVAKEIAAVCKELGEDFLSDTVIEQGTKGEYGNQLGTLATIEFLVDKKCGDRATPALFTAPKPKRKSKAKSKKAQKKSKKSKGKDEL
jgi:hypothetical protein